MVDMSEQAKDEVYYECVRCGTVVSSSELSKLLEIKCICGYRILRKRRPQVVKVIKAV